MYLILVQQRQHTRNQDHICKIPSLMYLILIQDSSVLVCMTHHSIHYNSFLHSLQYTLPVMYPILIQIQYDPLCYNYLHYSKNGPRLYSTTVLKHSTPNYIGHYTIEQETVLYDYTQTVKKMYYMRIKEAELQEVVAFGSIYCQQFPQ